VSALRGGARPFFLGCENSRGDFERLKNGLWWLKTRFGEPAE